MKKKHISEKIEPKQETWAYKLKRVPNTRRGTASGLSSVICLALFTLIVFALAASGFEITLYQGMIGAVGAEAVATGLFFLWANAASRLKS